MGLFVRYFLKETFHYTLLFFSSFLFLFTLIKGTFGLKEFIDFGISMTIFLKIYFLNALQLLSLVLPLSSYIALLFTLQRIKEEKELLALYSLGYSLRDFIKPLLLYIILITLATFIAHFSLLPKAKRIQKITLIELYEKSLTQAIPVKKPTPILQNFYLYVGDSQSLNSQNLVKKVIILEKKSPNIRGIYLSEEGIINKHKGELFLKNGWIFFLENQKNLEVFQFRDYILKLSLKEEKKEEFYIKRGEMNFNELKAELKKLSPNTSKYYRYLSEYYQRIFYAFTVIPLLIQGFFFSLYFKSHSKILLFLLGITFYFFIYMVYNFLLSLNETGKLTPVSSQLIFFSLFTIILWGSYKFFFKIRGISL